MSSVIIKLATAPPTAAIAPFIIPPSLSRARCATTPSAIITTTSACPQFLDLGPAISVPSRSSCAPSSSSSSSRLALDTRGRFVPRWAVGGNMPKSWLNKLGFGGNRAAQANAYNGPAYGEDDDKPAGAGQQLAMFGAGCFWGVELAFQRVAGVSRTEAGYSQGSVHNPAYGDVCDGDTGHSEVVRVHFDPKQCTYEGLLDVFWARHDPTTLNRQGGDVGTQYRSGIYFYSPEQEKAAKESMEAHQKTISKEIVTEILPAKKFYRAEEYHQQYLAKGGRFGFRQSTDKGCNDAIRCYG